MVASTFDTLDYFEKLKSAGFTEQQARVQVEAMQGVVRAYDKATRKDLATKGDIADVNARMREMELRLQKEIKDAEMRLLKWQIGGWIALAAIMAKGFGWLGF